LERTCRLEETKVGVDMVRSCQSDQGKAKVIFHQPAHQTPSFEKFAEHAISAPA